MQVAIQVSELRFSTEDGVLILDNLSFGVPRDGFVFVVGPPSSGKTLLLRLILRELTPTGGQILLIGRNVARLSRRKVAELRRRVGYVPEEPVVLSSRTVADNLAFKLRALGLTGEELADERDRALELAGLVGLEDQVAGELGEVDRRRLALALALCPEPTVLLCDDPFRDLPLRAQDELVQALSRVHRANTAILATTRDVNLPARHGFPAEAGEGSPWRVVRLRDGVNP
ncbi:MAG: ATP-binding cassette domain-containing protein [Candidatus Bipolaricaulaceae bacterium]